MSGIVRFVRDVICAPYSIPIGLINKKKPLDMCGVTSKKELDIHETSTGNIGYSGSIGTVKEDVSSITKYNVLNQAIQDVLRRNSNIINMDINTENTANISCPLTVPLSEDPTMAYNTRIRNIKTKKVNKDGSIAELPVFGCCPRPYQLSSIKVYKENSNIEKDVEDIFNEIDLHIQNNLTEQGSEETTNAEVNVLSSVEIQSILKQKIRENITNTINQNVRVSQGLNYKDRYQRCEYYMDTNGNWYADSKILKQLIDIDILSRNIIESTNSLVFNNKNKIDASTSVVVKRLTNYRVIVASLLLNIAVCYILYKCFAVLLDNIN